jgi:NB-ARC domain
MSVGSLNQNLLGDLPSPVAQGEALQSPDTDITRRATQGSSALSAEMVSMVSDFSLARREPRLPCFIIPPGRNPDFYGRSDTLQLLDDTFLPSLSDGKGRQLGGNKELRSLALCGPGGIGKTQVAAEYANTRKDHFDAVFWVYADQLTKIAEGFSHIAIEMGLVPEDSVDAKDQTVIRDVVKGWLANPLKTYDDTDDNLRKIAKWLLIFDNVDDPEILNDYWPLDGPGCVLVTSRDPLAKKSMVLAMDGVDLGPFNRDEAADLLLRLTGRDTETEGVEHRFDVAERLGGYPLAITQMAGVITRRDLSFMEFLQAYEEEEYREELLNLRLESPGRRTGYEHTLASVWAVEKLEHAGTLLDVLSLLDPDSIPERILTTRPGDAALEGFPSAATAYQRARSELLRSSLVSRDRNANSLVIHRLIQDTARGKMSHARFHAVFSATVRLLASVWPFDASNWRHSVARWAVCEQLFPHVLRIKAFVSRLTTSEMEAEANLELSRLLTDAGW